MKISDKCGLFLRDLYFYDIKSAFYEIANKSFYGFEDIEKENKIKRNIEIGKKQIGNPNLAEFLTSSSENLISMYLVDNELEEEEIIVLQKDGCILKKLLKDNKKYLHLDFRHHIDFIIISPDRKKFLYCTDKEVIVKGISNKYKGLDIIYKKFLSLNFYDKTVLFKQLQKIRDFVRNVTDKRIFLIEREDKKFIITIKHGIIELKADAPFSLKGIDREAYYNNYVRPFLESLFLYFY